MSGGNVTVTVKGVPAYTISASVIRRALAKRQVADHTGAWDTNAGFAKQAGVGKYAITACFNDGRITAVSAGRILAALGLEFDQIAVPVEDPADEVAAAI